MNILLLNLARFGDLLQTQAAITGLSRQGYRVGIVCLDNFVEAAALLSGVSHIAPVSGSAFLPEKASRPSMEDVRGNWPDALASLAVWRNDLYSAFVPDRVCNLIPSLSSQLLTSFVAKGAPCAGFFMDGHGFGVSGNPWAAFLRGTTLSRGVSPFNIVDIFRKIAGTEAGIGDNALRPPPEDALAAAREILRAELPAKASDCRGFVALQLGASEDRRRWPVSSFAALGDILWREGYCPVLLGSKSEIQLADRYGPLARHPYISMAGRTDLAELAALLCASKMLISNDTGTMHLAAGLGLPVLALFLATAQPFDTGPYLAGSCSLEPDMDCHPCAFGTSCDRDLACRSGIAPELLGTLALSRLEEGAWRMPECGNGSVRVWLSVVDEQGAIDLQSLSGHEMSGRASWMRVQRHFLRQFLDRDTSLAGFRPKAMNAPVSLPEDMFLAATGALEQARGFVDLMRQQGEVLLQRPVPLMRERFMASWGKVRETLGGSPPLKALAVLWEQETQGQDLHLGNVLTLAEDFSGLLEQMRGVLRD